MHFNFLGNSILSYTKCQNYSNVFPWEKEAVSVQVVREYALGMHVAVAVIARVSQSTFVGSPHYHHENRFVEKFVNDKLQETAFILQQWNRPGAFEASSVVAEYAIENEDNLNDVLSWTKVKTSDKESGFHHNL